MVKKILLIDVENIYEGNEGQLAAHWTHHPVGLLYLVSYAKKKYDDLDFRVFHTITSRTPLEDIKEIITEFKPELIGLRALSINQKSHDLVAEKIKSLVPDTPLIAGGPHATAYAKDIIKEKVVDLVVVGEGEETFNQLITKMKENNGMPSDVLGTVLWQEDKIHFNPARPQIQNLDDIPYPDYSLIKQDDYIGFSTHAFQSTASTAFICSSRGCPYQCFYCHNIFGKKVRRRSAEDIVGEMREHIEERGIKSFVFLDDIFNVPKVSAKEILREIIDKLPPVRLSFSNGLRSDQMDDELIDLLEQAGTIQIALAIESASPRLQKLMGKYLNIEKAKESIDKLSKKFIVGVFFMIGFPTETYEEVMDTINLAKSLKYVAQPTVSIVRVFKGSPIYDVLDPNPEQEKLLVEQANSNMQPKLGGKQNFYGDAFPDDKVPLKSKDVEELRWKWLMDVFNNKERIKHSHQVLTKFFDHQQVLDFYKNLYNKEQFNEGDLKHLLAGTGIEHEAIDNYAN